MIHHPERCIGCRNCQLVCSLAHGGECGPSSSRIRLALAGLEVRVSFGEDCDLCARCADLCPGGALEKGERK